MTDFHTFNSFDGVAVQGIIVPQEVYQAPQPYQPRPAIRFNVNGVLGIRLVDALANTFTGLIAADQKPILTDANRLSCRILWPGYDQWNDGIHVFDNNSQPYNVARLAYTIARTVQRFFTDNAHVRSREPRPDWAVNNVRFDSLYLIELRHVSAGSWQPVLSRRLM